MKLLTVTVDRLESWHRPGLLVIGDAAHVMSPIAGVGIKLAGQDAVAAANALAGQLADGMAIDALLQKVEDRSMFPNKLAQGFQRAIQDRFIQPLLASTTPMTKPPLAARLLDAVPLPRRSPARVWASASGRNLSGRRTPGKRVS
ncbi:2-polyprenyl-6-methoxyphenol hydroxylase-like FAD-dependent oxidoreductase [Sphingomonas sp. UYAg733]